MLYSTTRVYLLKDHKGNKAGVADFPFLEAAELIKKGIAREANVGDLKPTSDINAGEAQKRMLVEAVGR